ncbi:MAG: T9SS C-terminal target domain-containing protein [Balneolaceae bacterium]|nr:MAG: T9SS C-terminal target domain-containing protein [Balneolaceae bacterium]
MKRSLLLLLLPVTLLLFSSPSHSQSLQDKIGQMLMVGMPNSGAAKDTLITDILDRNLGGVILFAYNLHNPVQIRELTDELQEYANSSLLISVDQEGGIVARLDEKNGYAETYSAFELGYIFNSEDSTRAMAQMMAHWLLEAGFNMNLAPVVDVNVNPNSPAIGRLDRSFSNDEYRVYEHASWFIDEFNRQRIATALKHYPGHGSAVVDSHFGFTDITNTWQHRELDVYRWLIQDGYRDAIMTGHLFKQDWDTVYPASLSHYAITTVLRDSLGFEGVVITDELFMRALRDNYGFDESIVATINAGTDILLFNTNIYNNMSLARYVISLVTAKVADGTIDEATINAAYDRIMELKDNRVFTSAALVEGPVQKPGSIQVSNYPNPFNPATTLTVSLMESQDVNVMVTNTIGQVVQQISRGHLHAGVHTFRFDAGALASGVYFVHVRSGSQIKTHPMMLVR